MRAQPIGLFLSKWTIVTSSVAFVFSWEYPGTSVFLRWSHDGKFFARMTLDTLSIYETPVSGLSDGRRPVRSLLVTGVWCLSLFVLEEEEEVSQMWRKGLSPVPF